MRIERVAFQAQLVSFRDAQRTRNPWDGKALCVKPMGSGFFAARSPGMTRRTRAAPQRLALQRAGRTELIGALAGVGEDGVCADGGGEDVDREQWIVAVADEAARCA